MSTVLLNGEFLDLSSARVSALDASVQHAVGLFETMLAGVGPATLASDGPRPNGPDADRQPWVIDLDQHIERLCTSAAELGLSTDLRPLALQEAVLATVARSALPRARVRLTITGGDLNMLSQARAAARDPNRAGQPAVPLAHPTVLCVAQPATVYPQPMLDHGVMVTLADAKANPFDPTAAHKTLNYWWRLRELQAAGAKAAAEALVFDVTNHLAGGCVSNAIIIKGNALLTPFARGEEGFGPSGPEADQDAAPRRAAGHYLPSAVLPGVTRARVLAWAELGSAVHPALAGLRVQRRMLTINDVLTADELLLTNSSWGVLPVTRVEGRTIAAGIPGPISHALVELWARWSNPQD